VPGKDLQASQIGDRRKREATGHGSSQNLPRIPHGVADLDRKDEFLEASRNSKDAPICSTPERLPEYDRHDAEVSAPSASAGDDLKRDGCTQWANGLALWFITSAGVLQLYLETTVRSRIQLLTTPNTKLESVAAGCNLMQGSRHKDLS